MTVLDSLAKMKNSTAAMVLTIYLIVLFIFSILKFNNYSNKNTKFYI